MFRSIHLTKRKPGMSPEAFRDYYENHHSKLVITHVPEGGIMRRRR